MSTLTERVGCGLCLEQYWIEARLIVIKEVRYAALNKIEYDMHTYKV